MEPEWKLKQGPTNDMALFLQTKNICEKPSIFISK